MTNYHSYGITINRILLAFSIFLFIVTVPHALSLSILAPYEKTLLAWAHHHPYAMSCGFIGIYSLAISFGLPLFAIGAVLSGFLFGCEHGTIFTIISALIGSMIFFFLLRTRSERFRTMLCQKYSFIEKEISARGQMYLLGLRHIMLIPSGIITLLAALSPISTLTFFWTTMLGIIPTSTLFACVGSELNHLSDNVVNVIPFKRLFFTAALGLITIFITYCLEVHEQKRSMNKRST